MHALAHTSAWWPQTLQTQIPEHCPLHRTKHNPSRPYPPSCCCWSLALPFLLLFRVSFGSTLQPSPFPHPYPETLIKEYTLNPIGVPTIKFKVYSTIKGYWSPWVLAPQTQTTQTHSVLGRLSAAGSSLSLPKGCMYPYSIYLGLKGVPI